MPRVKAITTGSIPSFLDVILNFAESDTTSTLAQQDTWLAQIRAGPNGTNDGKLVMYGDDTWLKLFPDMFTRSDGTSSFFVSVSNYCHFHGSLFALGVVSCSEQVELNEVFVRILPKRTKM
jgi:predicted AlkP superfamily pyrophosphatase or phosphodiesterase